MSISKTKKEIELIRESCRISAKILKETAGMVRVGVTTKELDKAAEELIAKYEVESAFRSQPSGRNGEFYPAVLCTSVNEIVVHGLPSDYSIKSGDILSLDFGVIYRGYYSDVAVTIPVGSVSDEALRLIRVAKKSLKLGIKKAKPGNTIGDIGNTIQRYVESQGFGIVRDLVGHGVGQSLHEEPQIPNYGKRHEGEELKEGMVLAIEPMITAGSLEVEIGEDGYGYVTKDRSLSAHFEHTIVITKERCEILTVV